MAGQERKPKADAYALVKGARNSISAVLPQGLDVDRVIRGVRLALAQDSELQKANPESVLLAVMRLSQLGLEANTPLHHAALVVYGAECVPMIEYRGYQELARRSGTVRQIEARTVHEEDEFDVLLGTTPSITHRPTAKDRTDATLTHAYAVAFPVDGGPPVFDVLTRDDIDKARNVSRAKGGPWKAWYNEMARKTAVRRLSKYLVLSPEWAAALELDARADTGQAGRPIDEKDEPLPFAEPQPKKLPPAEEEDEAAVRAEDAKLAQE
jgi:recombination protein RecT